MKLEAMTPPHCSHSVLGKSIKHLVEIPSHVVAYGNHRAVHETNARALSKTLDAHEGHQVEEHAGHELHKARVGHGLREVACQMLLDEEEIIVLEVAERARMVAQQDGHYFALRHLPFAVSHSLILLSAKHSVLHPNSLPHCSLDDFMLVTSPLFVFCYPWR